MPGAYLYGWDKNLDTWGKGYKHLRSSALEPGKQVAIGAASTEILASNIGRTSFALVVRGDKNVFIKLGTAADNTCVEFAPGDVLCSNDYSGAVHGIEPGAAGRVDVFEV